MAGTSVLHAPGPDGWQKVQVSMGKLTTLRAAAAFILGYYVDR